MVLAGDRRRGGGALAQGIGLQMAWNRLSNSMMGSGGCRASDQGRRIA